MSLARRRYHGPATSPSPGVSVTPLDALVDAAEATVSLGVRELCCRLNASAGSFHKGADNLKHAAQVTISVESLRQVVEAEGKRVLKASEQGELKPGWQAADCKLRTAEGKEVSRVYLGVDGFMAPLVTDAEKKARRDGVVRARRQRGRGVSGRKSRPKRLPLRPRKKGADQRYKEFKLVQFHDEDMGRRLVSVTRGDCAEAGRVMRRDAGRIAFHGARERVGCVDAAAWIAGQIVRRCILLTALVLDFFHLGQHVNQGKRATFAEGSAAGEAWAGAVLHTAKHDGYDPFWDRLVLWRGQQRAKAKRAEADALLHYVCEHRNMIRYDECLKRGWRISSAPTESQCRAVPDRVKGPGKRWDADNAEAVMSLECIDQSGLWNSYWATCAWQNN